MTDVGSASGDVSSRAGRASVCLGCGLLSASLRENVACPKCGGTEFIKGRALLKTGIRNLNPQDVSLDLPLPSEVEAARTDPSKVFGNYTLVERIGSGGSADVYRAWQDGLRRFVALKVLRQSTRKDELGRFVREGHTVAQLNHEHIVKVHDVGEVDGRRYIALDLVVGKSLAELVLGKDRPPLPGLLKLFEDVCRAVAHAHAKGIVHRDLKPENILVSTQGHAYVTDFGIARPTEAGWTVTLDNEVVGTPAYMAPEQVRGGKASTRASVDVYGLGAVLYALLTGKHPFVGDPHHVLDEVQREEPLAPRSLVSGLHRDLEVICLKCLEKDAAKRYASVEDLAGDVRRFRDGLAIVARPPSFLDRAVRWVRRHPVVSTAASLTILFVVIIVVLVGVQVQVRLARFHRANAAQPYVQAGREELDQADRLFYIPNANLSTLRTKLQTAATHLSTAIETDSDNGETYFLRGKALFHLGDYKRSEQDFSSAIRRASTNPAFYYHRALTRKRLAADLLARAELYTYQSRQHALHEQGQLQTLGAQQDLALAVQHTQPGSERMLAEAELALTQGNALRAREIAEAGIAGAPERWEFYRIKAESLPLTASDDRITLLQQSLQRRPNDFGLAAGIAFEYEYGKTKPDDALPHLERAIALNPSDGPLLSARARLLRKLVRFSEALRDADHVIQSFPDALGGYYQRGQLQFFLGKQEDATQDLEQCLKLIPAGVAGWEYYNDLGCIHARAGRWDKAAECFREAFRRNHALDQQADSNLVLAYLRYPTAEPIKQVLREARETRFVNLIKSFIVCSVVTSLFPDADRSGADLEQEFKQQSTLESRLHVAVRRFYLGDYDGAIATLSTQLQETDLSRQRDVLKVASALCRDRNDLRAYRPEQFADTLFEKPDELQYAARVLRALALLLNRESNKTLFVFRAREDLSIAREQVPGRAEAHLAFGLLEYMAGNAELVSEHWNRAVERNPETAILTVKN